MRRRITRKTLKWSVGIGFALQIILTGVIFHKHHRNVKGVQKRYGYAVDIDSSFYITTEEQLKLSKTEAKSIDKSQVSEHNLKSHGRNFHNYLYHGKVMNEFCNRVLHRSVAQSNTLVVSPDVGKRSIIEIGEDASKIEAQHHIQKDGPAKVVISRSIKEGHATHVLPVNTRLNTWWNSNETKQRNDKWFLLSVFLSGNSSLESIDEMLSPSRAKDLFEGATLTYIVISVRSEKKVGDGTMEMSGLTAIQSLLDAKYKVQLLASSHFGEPGYHPNHLFKTTADAEQFLSLGAEMAVAQGIGNADDGEHFEALIFATQGLDLAIPSRLSYVDVSQLHVCNIRDTAITGRCDSKLDARALGNNLFLSCPTHHNAAKISFNLDTIEMSLDGDVVDEDNANVELWKGHEDINLAETACMKGITSTHSNRPSVSCATRVLKKPLPTDYKPLSESKSNLLFILIDPLSRSQFQRSLPNTAELLKIKGFAHFDKYTAVGNNSGPNQSAIYTGMPLLGGRDGIKNSSSHGKKKLSAWLWDQLELEGYVTLKAEDACVENSNMVQSMKPQTTHGEQLSRMLCFDFDRPNCLGKHLTANYLTKYTQQFIETYDDDPRPWAAFLSFVDSHEDSSTLISYIDYHLFNIINSQDLSTTTIVFTSDHGLHYGPSFQTNGERERAEPILHIHTPPAKGIDPMRVLYKNSKYWTTPFDLHETLVNVTLGENKDTDRIGSSLTKPLLHHSRKECKATPGIPSHFCSMLNPSISKPKTCTFVEEIPSALSFYADIPRKKRPSWPKCGKKTEKLTKCKKGCLCAGNCTKETECLRETRRMNAALKLPNPPLTMMRDPFIMQVCPTTEAPFHSVQLEFNIQPKKEIVNRHLEIQSLLTKQSKPHKLEVMPNILFLEIDSLSQSAALRHLPKTIAVLKSHQISKTGDNLNCPTGFCAAMFSKASVIGQNSIPNQLAALSGCVDQAIPGVESYLRPALENLKNNTFETWCPKGDVENPWLFDIVKDLGYVTFFGEEFCYTMSPYVVQDNAFKLDVDYDLKDVFCRLSKGVRQHSSKERSSNLLYSLEHDSSKNPDPCVGGRSRQELAFENVRALWDAYPDIPKFAYINSLAAHDYSIDLAYQALGVEAYDDYLSDFLKEMLQRPDAENTIIVLRSDHGLQGGPAPIDFSFQVEHMHHFHNIIVPEKFRGLSIDALFENQDKLVTGFDLYKTFRSVLESRYENGSKVDNLRKNGTYDVASVWSYNLLQDVVPEERSCEDAKIPRKFCPCIEERTDLMPYFYVGHTEGLEEMPGINMMNINIQSVPGYSMSRVHQSSICDDDDDSFREDEDKNDSEETNDDYGIENVDNEEAEN